MNISVNPPNPCRGADVPRRGESRATLRVPNALGHALQTRLRPVRGALDLIARAAMQPLTILELQTTTIRNGLLLTFDDGGKSALNVARLLEARGWRGHFFIATSLIGGAVFSPPTISAGCTSVATSLARIPTPIPMCLHNLGDEEMLAEWQTSCLILQDILGEPIVAASIPGGDMHAGTVITAAQAGIKYLFTSEPTLHHWHEVGILCLGRICLRHGVSLQSVDRFLHGRGFALQQTIRAGKQLIKRVVRLTYGDSMPRSLNESHISLPMQRANAGQVPNIRLATRADLCKSRDPQITLLPAHRFPGPLFAGPDYRVLSGVPGPLHFPGACDGPRNQRLRAGRRGPHHGAVQAGLPPQASPGVGLPDPGRPRVDLGHAATPPSAQGRPRSDRGRRRFPPLIDCRRRARRRLGGRQGPGPRLRRGRAVAVPGLPPERAQGQRARLRFYEKMAFEVAGETEISWILHRQPRGGADSGWPEVPPDKSSS